MAVLDRVPVDQIMAEAREVQPGRTLLKLFLGIFVVIGWLVGKASVGVSLVVSAIRVGWHAGRGGDGTSADGGRRGPA